MARKKRVLTAAQKAAKAARAKRRRQSKGPTQHGVRSSTRAYNKSGKRSKSMERKLRTQRKAVSKSQGAPFKKRRKRRKK